MTTPTIFNVTFVASVIPAYANYGVSGYIIGSTVFRSVATLTSALSTAFAKDLGTYRFLEVQITFNKGNEKRQAICTATSYTNVLAAIEEELEATNLTLDDLLEE